MIPTQGQMARVRSRHYLVEDVIPPPVPGQQTRVRLSCVEDNAQGVQIDVLWEKEVDAEVLGGARWDGLAGRGFDPPRLFSAYLHTLRWNCVTATEPKLFQAPYRAGIQVHPYQLEPLRKALLLPRVNLFIADDVGLGKTIEAGLILRELLLRQKVQRIVVACPTSVVLQWRDELENRFGLTFVVLDREFVLARWRDRGFGVNPWSTHSRFIISHSLLRDETYAGPLRSWLADNGGGSLLVLDEAHNAAPASATKYAIDSHFTRVVRDIAPLFEHRLFLSATPHNGHSNSFAALLEILDPQRFCRGVKVKGDKQLEPVMVRRLKEDLREIVPGFPARRIVQVDIHGLSADAPGLVLPRLLDEYAEAREDRLWDAPRSAQIASSLVLTSLQKRLLSSIEAFHRTLRVHRASVEKQSREKGPPADASRLDLLRETPGQDDDRGDLSEEAVEAEEEAQVADATDATASHGGAKELLARERELLDKMIGIADAARVEADPRVKWLIGWIRKELCPGGTWNDRRLLIFTEYTDTKRYVEQQLGSEFVRSEDDEARFATFHGGIGEDRREEIKRAFNADPAGHPLRVLIATDAAREGVNLQNHCADLVHFDVPWNPCRLEQRNGRIDRKLQRAPEVRCYYFVHAQRPEDRVLQALVEKTKTIAKELGSLSPVLERRLTTMLEGGIRRRHADKLAGEILAQEVSRGDRGTVQEELEVARERKEQLLLQLEGLKDMLEKSRLHLSLEEGPFRDALSAALEMQRAAPLRPLDGGNSWEFPAIKDQSWAETLDTLRVPRRRDQKPWEWRKEAPLRPVVFEDTGTLDDLVVHLHLEHRVAQRLLGRFLSQGFRDDDPLARACVCLTKDALPRVVLIGRLSLYGARAARLHDEILTVAARWVDPAIRKKPLSPYAEDAKGTTLELVEKSLSDPRLHEVPKAAQARLLASAGRDVSELLAPLEAQAEAAAKRAVEKLAARGDKEAREMAEILERQRTRIEKTLQQLEIPFPEEEKRQYEADRKHCERRRAAIAEELRREPERIRAVYTVKARRVEPVGVFYLWPVSG